MATDKKRPGGPSALFSRFTILEQLQFCKRILEKRGSAGARIGWCHRGFPGLPCGSLVAQLCCALRFFNFVRACCIIHAPFLRLGILDSRTEPQSSLSKWKSIEIALKFFIHSPRAP